ncbi:MAG: universal stress protein [Acidobacteriota bacterium]|jgi:nucleotide-binding universal stress UspA family protein
MSTHYPYKKIVIPVDFSGASVRSLEHGLGIARQTGASVVVLFVVDTSFPYPDLFSFEDPNQDYFKVMRDRARKRMGEWLEKIPAAGEVEIETVVGHGRPATEIVEIAEEVEAGLIVISRHAKSGLRQALMGSTTEAVVRSAPCPVVVLPPEAGTDG